MHQLISQILKSAVLVEPMLWAQFFLHSPFISGLIYIKKVHCEFIALQDYQVKMHEIPWLSVKCTKICTWLKLVLSG